MLPRVLALISVGLLLTFVSPASAENRTIYSQLTTQIVNNKPTNNVADTTVSTTPIFYYTYIEGCRGCVLIHEWLHDGQLIHTYRTDVIAPRQYWWSKNPGNDEGNWVVRTLINNTVVQVHNLNYSTGQQATLKSAAPLEYQVQKQVIDDCEQKLTYFNDLATQNPDDPYYDFMLKKWSKRCVMSR